MLANWVRLLFLLQLKKIFFWYIFSLLALMMYPQLLLFLLLMVCAFWFHALDAQSDRLNWLVKYFILMPWYHCSQILYTYICYVHMYIYTSIIIYIYSALNKFCTFCAISLAKMSALFVVVVIAVAIAAGTSAQVIRCLQLSAEK